MARYCNKCHSFRGAIITCRLCGVAVCPDCQGVDGYCMDCYTEVNRKIFVTDYIEAKLSYGYEHETL